MDEFHCKICKRNFLSQSELTRHANAVHHGKTYLLRIPKSRDSVLQIPEHDSSLWNTPITRPPKSTSSSFAESSTSHIDTADVVNETYENEPRYYLRSQVESESEENIEENIEEMEIDLQTDLDRDFDSEDLQGASFDDALDVIEGKNRPEQIAKWPNDAYREFMELVIEGNISNKIGDKIIKFFNRHSNLDNSPLPSSTKSGKDFLNEINSPSLDFKEKVVATFNEVDFTLYYRPVFRAIQTLLQRSEVADRFVHKGILKKNDGNERIFREPFECNWWLKTEKTLPPLNHLLSIILYSDATTFDGFGKSSGHPVFLTFGNLPNRVRNSSESKVLIGFLPKVQDSGIKTSESFRNLQRTVFHKCFRIMLRPLLEKPDGLYFAVKGQPMCFTARISFFLSDMLEADEITATYKSARCKMPCHTCMVLQGDLNNMRISLKDMPLRTHENMQQVIQQGQGKNFSVHSVENAFWKFP
jgi:hypothetical protein